MRILRILALSFLFAGRAFADCQLGSFAAGDVVDCAFTTATSTPATLSGTPALALYCSNSTTETTSGVTLDVDFDGRTGLNHVRVDTSGLSTGECQMVITAGTVGGASVVGSVVGGFSIGRPATLTAAYDPAKTAAQASDIPTAAAISDQVWDEALSGHTTAGTTGKKLGDIPTTSSSLTAADVWTYSAGGGRTLTACSFCISAAAFWSYDVRTLTTISGTTNILSPTGTVGTLRLTRNDSYYLADGPIPTFTRTGWEDLSTATEIRLTIRRRPPIAADADPVLLSVTDRVASRITGTGEQTVAFEMSSTDTADLVPGISAGKYDIQVTFADGHERTLETGLVTVIEDQTRPE